MKYALLIHDLPGIYERLSDDGRDAVFGEYFAVGNEPNLVGGEELQPVETATTVGRQGR